MENYSSVARGNVCYHLGDEEWGNTTRTILHKRCMFATKSLDATNARANGAAKTSRINVVANFESAILHCLSGSSKGVEGIDIIVAYHSLVDIEVFRFEIQDLSGDLYGETLSIYFLNIIDCTFAIQQTIPHSVDAVTKRRYASESGYNNSFHIYLYSFN